MLTIVVGSVLLVKATNSHDREDTHLSVAFRGCLLICGHSQLLEVQNRLIIVYEHRVICSNEDPQ